MNEALNLDFSATADGETMSSGFLQEMFVTPVARFTHPAAATFNQKIADLVVSRAQDIRQSLSYKRGTLPEMAGWGEPVIDKLTRWMQGCARAFAKASLPVTLQQGHNSALDAGTQARPLRVVVINSWASLYRTGDQHPPHYHPNTAVTAIYYVQSPWTCELDLYDPRPYIDYYNPGLTFGGADQNVRLKCQPGELLLFPGWLRHGVPEFTGEDQRISLSWNLDFTFAAVERPPRCGEHTGPTVTLRLRNS